jgi:hypothetical protein
MNIFYVQERAPQVMTSAVIFSGTDSTQLSRRILCPFLDFRRRTAFCATSRLTMFAARRVSQLGEFSSVYPVLSFNIVVYNGGDQ